MFYIFSFFDYCGHSTRHPVCRMFFFFSFLGITTVHPFFPSKTTVCIIFSKATHPHVFPHYVDQPSLTFFLQVIWEAKKNKNKNSSYSTSKKVKDEQKTLCILEWHWATYDTKGIKWWLGRIKVCITRMNVMPFTNFIYVGGNSSLLYWHSDQKCAWIKKPSNKKRTRKSPQHTVAFKKWIEQCEFIFYEQRSMKQLKLISKVWVTVIMGE